MQMIFGSGVATGKSAMRSHEALGTQPEPETLIWTRKLHRHSLIPPLDKVLTSRTRLKDLNWAKGRGPVHKKLKPRSWQVLQMPYGNLQPLALNQLILKLHCHA